MAKWKEMVFGKLSHTILLLLFPFFAVFVGTPFTGSRTLSPSLLREAFQWWELVSSIASTEIAAFLLRCPPCPSFLSSLLNLRPSNAKDGASPSSSMSDQSSKGFSFGVEDGDDPNRPIDRAK